MKILLAYDGSTASETAIADLSLAGLSATGSLQIISVAEVCLPQPSMTDRFAGSPAVAEIATTFKRYGERSLTEAALLSKHAEMRVRKALPEWDVVSIARYGSPAREILDASRRFEADLIIVGSHGHSSSGRFMLGSIAQKVLTEASCSVRIARRRVDDGANRLVVGFDGSDEAFAAVRSVAERNWGTGAEIFLVTASEPATPDSTWRFVPPAREGREEINLSDRRLLEQLGKKAQDVLRKSGLKATLNIRPGSPKQVLVDEAKRLGIDCIFVGASSGDRNSKQIHLGSTSAAVAARAYCSVEVVRENIET